MIFRSDSLGTLAEIQDRDSSVRSYVDPDTGFLHADGVPLTRVGVFRYSDESGNSWGELRDESEIFHPDSIASFDPATLTNDHPAEFVSVDSWKGDAIGMIGKIRRDGKFLRGDLVITDPAAIADVQSGKREISLGYWSRTVPASGIRDGIPYSRKQLRPKGNHCAIVDRGRAGPECRIDKDQRMNTKKIKIDGFEVELPAEIADAIEAERKTKTKTVQIGDADVILPIEVADMFGKPDPEDKDEDESKDSAASARADALEAEFRAYRDAESKRIDERVRVVTLAREILGGGVKFDGLSNDQIRRQVLAKIADGVDLTGKDAGYVSAYLDATLEARADSIARDSLEIETTESRVLDLEKIRDDYMNKRKGA